MTAQPPLPLTPAGAVPFGKVAALLQDDDGGRVFIRGEPDLVDLLDSWEQVEAEQSGDGEANLGLAVGVDVVAFDLHGGAVANRALDHRVYLGSRGPQGLGVHDHRPAFDVPVDEDPAPAV